MEKKTKEIEQKLEESTEDKYSKFTYLEKKLELQEKNNKVLSDKFIKLETNDIVHVKCNLCEFSTTSKKGMGQ